MCFPESVFWAGIRLCNRLDQVTRRDGVHLVYEGAGSPDVPNV